MNQAASAVAPVSVGAIAEPFGIPMALLAIGVFLMAVLGMSMASTEAERAEPRGSTRAAKQASRGSSCEAPARRREVVYRTVAPMMILVAGPYRSGTNDDPDLIRAPSGLATRAGTS
jgi:hypothetical protein